MRRFILISSLLLCFALPALADDQDVLPPVVQSHAGASLDPVGSSTYRKFGFRIYRAILWAKNKAWNPRRTFALELCYNRSLSKDTLVDTVMDDIRQQNVADEATLARWHEALNQALPAVEDGDVLVGLARPGKKSQLFYNGTQVASIDDANLSKAFFNIWLGTGADRDMRSDLLGQNGE